jgi:SCF-associated factor 1
VGFKRWTDVPVRLDIGNGKGKSWAEGLRDSLAGVEKAGDGKVGIVDLQASGWGFIARDMSGGVWVWGE